MVFKLLNKNIYGSTNQHSEVIHQAFTVEEVIWSDEEVPTERSEPRQAMYPVYGISDGYNLLEAFHLDDKNLHD